jgi:hypothetical protein
MKRTYIKPAVEILDIETKATCVVDSWNVRGENYDPSTDHGYIIEDQGEGKNGKDDPWDSTDW